MNRAQRRSEQLGMPYGTANNRLRKNILFQYVVKAGDNFCFKCGSEIKTVEELSIEHKLPWEGRDTELFWDIDNIAFSHLACNRPHNNVGGGAKRRKIGPEGTAWCATCKTHKLVVSFNKNSATWNGYQPQCKECHKRMRYG